MKKRKSILSLFPVGATHCLLSSLMLWVAVPGAKCATAQLVHEGMRDDAGAAAAFEAIMPVLRRPRCINCHSQGDFPRQGELFKDPQRNGHRTPEQIVEHMHTPLVLWGWSPGDGRTPVPIPQREFFAKVQAWAEKGAACPLGQAPQHPQVSGSYSDQFP